MIKWFFSKWKTTDWIIFFEILIILILVAILFSSCSGGGSGGPGGGPTPNSPSTGSIDGFVKYSGIGVQGATVYIATGGKLYLITTNTSGYFKIENAPSGAQTIYVATQGYNIASRAITVPNGITETLSDFSLSKTTETMKFSAQINKIDPSEGKRSATCLTFSTEAGTHFGNNCGTVTIGGIAATCVRVWTDSEIQVWIPATAPLGSVNVVVDNGKGESVPKTVTITQ